jgi:ABC-type dipeptide/oligopeptide/nickel transport system ATPase subunit
LQLSKDILDKNITLLSGGEKQRIALIRSVLINPKFILLDEPTSALDIFNEEVIFNFLKKLSKKLGIIIVSHSKNIIINADIKILLDKNGYKIFENDIDEKFIYQIIKEENEK